VSDDLDYTKLGRFLAGECSDAEAADVEAWLAADPAHRRVLDTLASLWRGAETSSPQWHEDEAWRKLAAQLDTAPSRTLALGGGRAATRFARTRRRALLPPLAAAATAILAIGGYVWVAKTRHAPSAPLREVVARRGQRTALDLPDGSRVLLAPESRVRLAKDFGAPTVGVPREILLEGEAYFQVHHDSTRPFRVETGTAVVEDIGTEFVVVTHPERHGVDVAVVSGAVALRRASVVPGLPLVTVRRGDLARLDSAGTATVTPNANLAPYVAWTRGDMAFDGTPLREVARELGRWYDLDVRVADSALGKRRLTASFGHEPVSQILEVIARSLNARVERRGHLVTFQPNSR